MIFQFFKMAAATILDFQICEILWADGVCRAQTHNCAKFRHNRRSITEILQFFEFWNREILLIIRIQRVEVHERAKFR